MPVPITSGFDLRIGDVVMVQRDMEDRDTGKPYVWRYFVIVTEPGRWFARGLRIGAEKGKETTTVKFDEGWEIQLLAMSEYPDGVHAYRMMHILKGNIEGIV